MLKNKKLIFSLLIITLLISSIFYLRHQVYYSRGNLSSKVIFKIEKGEGNEEIATKLEEKKLISNKVYFYYYLRKNDLLNKIMPGDYTLAGNLTIPEIVAIITNPPETTVKITFPEGWDSKMMASRLKENGLDGQGFLDLANNPGKFQDKYDFLKVSKTKTLEGYLFPDTYFFNRDATAEEIVDKMLANFGNRVDAAILEEITKQNRALKDEIIMASLIQGEVKTMAEMKLVSGVFWKRLAISMPIQSDVDYGTYDKRGLPEQAVCNPGMDAIRAAVYPQSSDYLYFVSNKETGETFFARTFEEHKENKIKAGY